MIGWTKDAPLAGLTKAGAGGRAGVGLGLCPPLAKVEALAASTNAVINNEEAFLSNIAVWG
jgi:hypothetical protein